MTKKIIRKTPVKPKRVDSTDTSALLDRIDSLETQVKVLTDGLAWAGKEITPMFGVGGIGAYLSEVAFRARQAAK